MLAVWIMSYLFAFLLGINVMLLLSSRKAYKIKMDYDAELSRIEDELRDHALNRLAVL